MKQELKPCPFCGSTDIKIDNEFYEELFNENGSAVINVTCECCGASVPVYSHDFVIKDKDHMTIMAAERWNHRKRFEKHPTVYIAGAIKNDPDYKEKFATVAAFFREKGYDVINPAETVLDEYAGYKDYIDHGLAQLMTADVVCNLIVADEFISSAGAGLECRYADTVGIPIIRATYDREKKEVTLG